VHGSCPFRPLSCLLSPNTSFLAPSSSLSMDPVTAFGLAAGALQFLQCAFDMTKDTYLAMKNGPRDIVDLLASTGALSAVFAVLGKKDPRTGLWQVSFPSLKTDEMAKLFTSMEKELNALGTQLCGLEPLRDEHQLRNRLRSILPRLKWALRADEVKRILNQIRTYQEVLIFATTTENLYAVCSLRGLPPDVADSVLSGEALVHLEHLRQQHVHIMDRLNDLAHDQVHLVTVQSHATHEIAKTRSGVQQLISYEEQALHGERPVFVAEDGN
jgi:hypothetical protein